MTLERPGQRPLRESTKIPVQGASSEQTEENKRLAFAAYCARMGDLARARHQLPAAASTTAPAAVTFNTFADWYALHRVPRHAGAERELEMIKTLRGAFGRLALDAITQRTVDEWRTVRARQVSPRTVNREIDLLKSILRAAADVKHLAASPLAGMSRLRIVKPKRRLMAKHEERRLLRTAADAADRALLILGVDTLVRLKDLLDLRREDRAGAWLYIRDPKDPTQSDPYEVPLSRRAARALDAIPDTGPYYFEKFRQWKSPSRRRREVRVVLERWCKRAGIRYGRKHNGITFHWATRRTGATRLIVDKRIDPKTVQEIGHWKDPSIVLEIYSETNRTAMLAAVRTSHTRRSRKRAKS